MKAILGIILGLTLLSSIFVNNVGASQPSLMVYAGKDQRVQELSEVKLFSSVKTLPNKLTYSWKQISGETVKLSASDIAKPTFVAPKVTKGETKTLVFAVTIEDDYGRSAGDSVTIIVVPIDDSSTTLIKDSKTSSNKSTLEKLLITKSDTSWPDKFWNSFEVHTINLDSNDLSKMTNVGVKDGISQEFVVYYNESKLPKGGIRIDILELTNAQYASEMFQSMKNFMMKEHVNESTNGDCYLSNVTLDPKSGSVHACAIQKYFVILRIELSIDNAISSQSISEQIMKIISKKIKSDIKVSLDTKTDTKKDTKSKTIQNTKKDSTKEVDTYDSKLLIKEISIKKGVVDLAINSLTNKIYVVSWLTNSISIIDGKTDKVIKTISTDFAPSDIEIDEYENLIFVSGKSKTTSIISIIDGKTNKIILKKNLDFFSSGLFIDHMNKQILIGDNYTEKWRAFDYNLVEKLENEKILPKFLSNSGSVFLGEKNKFYGIIGGGASITVLLELDLHNKKKFDYYVAVDDDFLTLQKIQEHALKREQTKTKTIPRVDYPIFLTYNENKKQFFISTVSFSDQNLPEFRILVVNSSKLMTEKTKIIEKIASQIAFDKNSDLLYSLNHSSIGLFDKYTQKSITVFNSNDFSIVDVIEIASPTKFLINPSTGKLYVINSDSVFESDNKNPKYNSIIMIQSTKF